MKRAFIIVVCLIQIFLFTACNSDDITSKDSISNESTSTLTFTETEDNNIISSDGIKYTYIGSETHFWCIGNLDFIGHVTGEEEAFIHEDVEITTGMYSVDGKQDILVRYFPNNEFYGMYAKTDLITTKFTLDNSVRLVLLKNSTFQNNGITETKQFIEEIKNGQTAEEAGLYDLVRQPNGMLKNCYVYGYICAIIQEDINVVIPLTTHSFDDQAYSVEIDGVNYVLQKEWLDKFTTQ